MPIRPLVEAPQIQRHSCRELAADRIEPADHAGATTERDDGDAMLPAIAQNLGDVPLVTGQHHRVGRVLHIRIVAAQQIQGRLPARVQQPVAVAEAAVAGADDGGQSVTIGVGQR